jgi:hypothetical protein
METSLNELPPSADEFWDGERYTRDMSKRVEHEHVFEYESAREIKCKCGFGLVVGFGDTLKDGHLYHFEKLIV